MQDPLGTVVIAFAIILGGAFAGLRLRNALPERHLADKTKDVIKLGTGLIGTLAALVLSPLISSANSSYPAQSGHVRHIAADLILLDQLLAQHGPEAAPVRVQLPQAVVPLIDRIWRDSRSASAVQSPFQASRSAEDVFARIMRLGTQGEAPRAFKERPKQTQALIWPKRSSSCSSKPAMAFPSPSPQF
jgi:hypothetical protein